MFPLRPDEAEPPEPEFDPELEDNPEVAEAPKPMSKRSKEMMMREAKSEEHLFTHRPKNPFCETCVRSKMQAPQARRRHGSSSVDAKAVGDHVTADHVVSNDETYGFKGEWNALVVKDVFTQFRYFYPSARQDADSCVRAFQHFTKPDDHVGIFYSDNSGEIAAAVKSMGWRHVLSQPYVRQSSGVIEREIRTILEGARANLFQSGLPVELWPLAAQHHAFALNVTIPDDKDKSPWALRFGDEFPDTKIPFGAKLLYWINRQRIDSKQPKFLPTSDVGIFVGYHVQPGFTYTHEILVLPLKNLPDKLRTGDINPLRVKQYEFSLLDETFVFPAKQTIADDKPCSPDKLEYEPESHLQPGEAAVPEEVLMEDPPAPAEGLADHDPDHMPDGSAVPPGFQWDGFRLVRARKSSRPPGIPSGMWKLASPKERARVAEEYCKELARKKEAKPAAADVAATAVCV